VMERSVISHENYLLGKGRSNQATLVSQLETEQYCALDEWLVPFRNSPIGSSLSDTR
jgi:hypothetical protein